MFTGAQIITTKLIHRNNRNEIINSRNEDKITQDLINMAIVVPRSKAAIVVESQEEKIERKALVQERKYERLIEQKKIVQHMEDLMEKVLHETSLSKKDENNLRNKIKSIKAKVNKESDNNDITSLHPTVIRQPSLSSQIKSDSIEQSSQSNIHSKPLKSINQGPFLLWYDKHSN